MQKISGESGVDYPDHKQKLDYWWGYSYHHVYDNE